jgi:hypothetical protein
MARSFSNSFTAALNSNSLNYFFLIELELNSTAYYTSFHRNIVYDGHTWLGDGGVFSIEPPNFSSILDREAYTIVLTDIADSVSDSFKLGVIGNTIKVSLGLLDSNGDPLLGAGDVSPTYSGFIDSPSVNISWDEKTAKIEGTSPMADLDQVNLTMVSKDGMDQKNSTDTSFDSIYEDSETHISWGKI